MIPYNQLSLVDIFQIVRKFMNLTNLSFSLYFKTLLTWMNLFRLLSEAFLCINGQNPQIPFVCFSLGSHYSKNLFHSY